MGSEFGRRVWNSAPPQRPFRVCDHKRRVRKGLTAATREELLDKVSGQAPAVGKPRDSKIVGWRSREWQLTKLPPAGWLRNTRPSGLSCIWVNYLFSELSLAVWEQSNNGWTNGLRSNSDLHVFL